jgi:acid phosphatase class B
MKKKAVIVDIDGTIADNRHRQHFLEGEKKDWDSFFSKVIDDEPIQITIEVVRALSERYRIIFVTGRPEKCKGDTYKWLDDNYDLGDCIILFRKDGDFRPDHETKLETYRSVIEPIYDVKLVIDDRDKVVKMWRKIGLPCWQVAEGNF